MQIKDEGALMFLGKLKSDPTKRSRNKYCRFHRDHGHDTADCYDLKQQIEALIREGKLQKFVSKERTDTHPLEQAPRWENNHPRSPVGDIRMIIGGDRNYRIVQKGSEDLPQDGSKCPANGLGTQDSTKGKPDHWIFRGRREASPSPT